MLRDEASIPSSIGLGGAEGGWVRYWDESSTLAMQEFQVETPSQPSTSSAPLKKEKKKKGSEYVVICPGLLLTFGSISRYGSSHTAYRSRGGICAACIE